MSSVEAKKTKIKAAIKNISDSLNVITEILLEGAPAESGQNKQKRKKDPNAPKQPPSSFLLYMLSIKDEVERENPESSFAEKSKIYGANWQKLSEQEKKVFVDKAKVEKEKYLKQVAAYTKSQGESSEPPSKKAKKETPKKETPKKEAPKKKTKEIVAEPEPEPKVVEETVEAESSEAESSDSDSESDGNSSDSSSSSSSGSDDNATSSDSDSD